MVITLFLDRFMIELWKLVFIIFVYHKGVGVKLLQFSVKGRVGFIFFLFQVNKNGEYKYRMRLFNKQILFGKRKVGEVTNE